MRIIIDIGHPAHVHYFRNFIKIMELRGHKFLVIARKRAVVHELLKYYSIKFLNRGKGDDTRIGKIFYMFYATIFFTLKGIKFHPDVFMSIGSPYAAQAAFLLRKPHIVLTDTEHVDNKNKFFVYPFTKTIISPNSFYNDLGEKQVKINAVFEAFYLHREFFKPKEMFKTLNIKNGSKYVIIRLVGWHAHHDHGQSGISGILLRKIIILLKSNYQIFISSENELEKDLKQYELKIEPNIMHDVLKFSSLFIGESATMASECAYLGVPAIYINSLPLMGYLKYEQKFNLLKHFSSSDNVFEYLIKYIKEPNILEKALVNKTKMLESFINPTQFLVWFIENYSESTNIMKNNPSYQRRFI